MRFDKTACHVGNTENNRGDTRLTKEITKQQQVEFPFYR